MDYLAALLLTIAIVLADTTDDFDVKINSVVVVRPRSMSVEFWTPERMRAAREPTLSPAPNTTITSTSRSQAIPTGPPITIPAVKPDFTSVLSRAISTNGRHVATTGRVFWSCSVGSLSSCSAGVIPSKSGDLIITAAHCVYDTTTLRWMSNCNWVFVPGYKNGNAPYGRWPARLFAAPSGWTRSVPDYNYDVAFVALSQVNGRHITQVTGSQGLGFNYPRGQLTYAFGYPANLAKGEVLQVCSGKATTSKYTVNRYKGQGLSKCLMTGGCSGGPWLQQFNEVSGVGIVYSINSFTYLPAPNTMNGPVFDSYIESLWKSMTNR